MASIDTNTFQAAANLSLWFKVYTGDSLNLADVPEIIALRWTYFRDNWSQFKQRIVNLATLNFDPDYMRFVIDDLTDFIDKQRSNTTDVNPFASNSIYYRFYPVFDTIKLESIALTNEEKAILAKKKAEVLAYSKNNFLKIKSSLRAYRDVLADQVGLTDPDYNRVYGRSAVATQASATIVDINLMGIVQGQLTTVDFVLANLFAVDTAVDPFALARQNANNPDINIGQYQSGKLIKLHYNEDLPSLSQRVFGTPDKWLDIALANGLKEPYTDEVGQQLFLIANGSGNQINIAGLDTSGNENIGKFFINQFIYIQSEAFPFPTQRTVTGIRQIPISGEIVLTISGDTNMGQFLLSDSASIRIFKPNTINSSQYILIPSGQPLPSARVDELPWFMTGKAADEKNTKIDIAVGTDGKLLQTSTGDIALSYGLDNAIQAIRAKMVTEKGSNRRHPNYGLINLAGIPTNISTEAKNALVQSINSSIRADKRFDRIESIDVQRNPSATAVAYDVTLQVKLAGSNTVIPITFTVTT